MLLHTERAEKLLFHVGCLFFVMQAVSILILWFIHPEVSIKIIAVITASILGGRMAAILTGLELGLHHLLLVFILFVFNTAWVFLFSPLIISFYNKVIKLKFFGKMLIFTKRMAEMQKENVASMGRWGLPIFVWLPFPWTGALVGFVIGYLMGIPLKNLILVVLTAMLMGIVSWTLGFECFLLLTGKAGKIFSVFMICGMLLIAKLRLKPTSQTF